MPAAWVLAEWVRGWFFTGFTSLQLGYSQVGAPLEGLLPVGGIYLASWAVALSAGLTVLFVRRTGPGRWRWLAALVLVWVVSGSLGLIRWTAPTGEALRVALVQGNLPQDEKWLARMRRPTLERYLVLTRAHWDADLVVWPESALPGLRDGFDGYIERLDEEARAEVVRAYQVERSCRIVRLRHLAHQVEEGRVGRAAYHQVELRHPGA